LALSDRHLPWVESDEEIDAIESDPTRFEPPGQAFVLGPKPGRVDQSKIPF
jgi:hypothetical protein